MREKVGKSRNTVFFQWFGAPEGRKVSSLKRRVRSQLARWEMKNCTPLWREAHLRSQNVQNTLSFGPLLEVAMSKKCTPLWREAYFQVKMYKTHQVRTTFGSWDVEKVHAVVARSTFPSQNVQSTLSCRTTFGSCDVEKVHAVVARSTFPSQNVQNTPCSVLAVRDVEKVHAVVARSTFRSQNVKNTRGSDHFWKFRCRFASLHCTTLHYTTLRSTTLHYITLHYNYS